MKKTYADICLERAEKATEGPWVYAYEYSEIYSLNPEYSEGTTGGRAISLDYDKNNEGLGYECVNSNFITHARVDVPELARRLKIAITLLKDEDCAFDCRYEGRHPSCGFHNTIDELESIPQGAKK